MGFAFALAESYSRGVGRGNNLVLAARGSKNRAGGVDSYGDYRLAWTCLGQEFFLRGDFEIIGGLPGPVGDSGEEILVVVTVEDEAYLPVAFFT